MSQIKAYKPEVAVLVGIQASLLLNHIKYWMESKNVEKVYLTNKQISNDFKGTLSESQIQRAKKKLIDNGLVTTSHDKGHLRTTHYMLTEKSKKLLGLIESVVTEAVEAVKKVASKFKAKPKSEKPKSSMEESFKNQGKTNHAVPMPKGILDKLRGKKAEEPVLDDDLYTDEDTEIEQMSEDEYFKTLDMSMLKCHEEKEELTFSEIMKQAFSRVPNLEQFEKNRQDLEMARNFKEDY